MANHPLNLALRFLLECFGLYLAGLWGWHWGSGIWAYLLPFLIPVFMGLLWVTFAVPEDPSRSGKSPVKTPGWIRLILELGIFFTSFYMTYSRGEEKLAWLFISLVIFHYLISFERISWLLKQKV